MEDVDGVDRVDRDGGIRHKGHHARTVPLGFRRTEVSGFIDLSSIEVRFTFLWEFE